MHFLRFQYKRSMFLHGIMTCMHIPKTYNENHGRRTILSENMRKNYHPPHNCRPKMLDSTDTVDFVDFMGRSESIL